MMIAVSEFSPPAKLPPTMLTVALSVLLHVAAVAPLVLTEGPSADVQPTHNASIEVAFVIESRPTPEEQPPPEAAPAAEPAPVIPAESDQVLEEAAVAPLPQPAAVTARPAHSTQNPPPSSAPAESVEEAAFVPPRGEPAYLNNPPPLYPSVARRRGAEGTVLLLVEVDADGRPSDVRIKASSGFSPLDFAAVDAVRRWRFAPARRNGRPVAAEVQVPIRFRLNEIAQR